MQVAWLIVLWVFCVLPSVKRHPNGKYYKNRVFYHRGYHDNATIIENSLPAFKEALKRNTGIETDIQLTKDGIPIIYHDFHTKRLLRDANNNIVDKKIKDCTLEELQSYHLLHTNEKVMTFGEFLKCIDGRVPLILEIKLEETCWNTDVCEKVSAILQAYAGVYCIESFHPGVLRWFKKHRKDVMRGQLASRFVKEKGFSFSHFLCQSLMINFLGRPHFVAYRHLYGKSLVLRFCRLCGAMSVAWTVKSKKEFRLCQKYFDAYIIEGFEASITGECETENNDHRESLR